MTSAAASARGGSLSAIRPARLYVLWRARRQSQHPETLLLQFRRRRRRGGRGFDERRDRGESALHNALRSAVLIHRLCFRHFRRRIDFGRPAACCRVAAERIAASIGSCPPSELVRAASVKTRASSKPGMGRTAVNASLLRVKVPVLSDKSTSMVAASSTAESRVGSTPRFAKARAPSAEASVNVAGIRPPGSRRAPPSARGGRFRRAAV